MKLGVAMLLFSCYVYPVIAQECRELSAQMKRSQQTMYEYALIADAAYGGQPPANNCCVEATRQRITIPDVEQHPLIPQHIDTKWRSQFLELWQAHPLPRPDNMGRYIGDDGVTYVTCTYDAITPQFALTWTELRRTLQGDDALSEVGVHLQVRAVTPRAILPADEELGLIRLTRDPRSSNEREELVAIRGTDFTQIPSIMTTIHDLLDESCVYEMAAIVVDVIGDEHPTSHISVVGHSLGGSAVQHIVQDYTIHPWRHPENRRASSSTYSAYSFNAVGLKPSSAVNADTSNLWSYVVDGEIVSWLGEHLGRTQAGTVIRFIPPETWPETGWLRIVEDVLQWDQPESVRRHRLSAVQQGLCECINGQGSMAVQALQ